MKWYYILIIVLIAVFLFMLIVGLIIHRIVYGRINLSDDIVEKYAKNYFHGDQLNEYHQCSSFIKSLPLQELSIKSYDNITLKAHFYNAHSDKTVILVHGYHSISYFDFSFGIRPYYDRGFNILLIDQRAHNGSEGKYTTFGIKERYDLKAWIDLIDQKFPNGQIVLSGISMGSSTILYTLGLDLPSSVKCAICDCGYTTPIDVLRHGLKSRIHVFYHTFAFFVNLGSIIHTGKSLYHLNTKDTLKNNQVPVLLVHGKKDSVVPYKMSEKNLSYLNDKSKLVSIDNANHGMSFVIDKEKYLENSNIFLNEYIK